MKNVLIMLFVLMMSLSHAQQQNRIVLADDGIFTLSLGTIIGTSTYIIHKEYPKKDFTPVIIGGISFAGTITVGLYIISFDRKPVYTKSKHPRWL